MAFEVFKGRHCDSIRVSQADEILKKGLELVANGKALQLSQSSNETLSALLNNSKDANSIQALQFQKDLNSEKKKTKRWRKISAIETVGLIGLLILIL